MTPVDALVSVVVEWMGDEPPHDDAYAVDRSGVEYLINLAKDLGDGRWGLVLRPLERGERIPDGAEVVCLDWRSRERRRA